MKHLPIYALSLLSIGGIASPAAAQTTIDFETGAPNLFGQTTPLTTLYSSVGITFSGVNGNGGSILNDAYFSQIGARSGTDFLAFNVGVGSGRIERATFTYGASAFAVFLTGNIGVPGFFASAYDSGGILLGTTTVAASPGLYSEVSLAFADIAYVEFGATGGTVFAADDLSFTANAVPEPANWAMMIGGMAVAGGALRRRKAVALTA